MNASDRLNTCKSKGSGGVLALLPATGARVSNTYATYPWQGDNPEKSGLIPRNTAGRHLPAVKGSDSGQGWACGALVSW